MEEKMKFCPNCGRERYTETRFCVNCGHEFDDESELGQEVTAGNPETVTAPASESPAGESVYVHGQTNGGGMLSEERQGSMTVPGQNIVNVNAGKRGGGKGAVIALAVAIVVAVIGGISVFAMYMGGGKNDGADDKHGGAAAGDTDVTGSITEASDTDPAQSDVTTGADVPVVPGETVKIPSFLGFADGRAKLTGSTAYDEWTTYVYELDAETVSYIADEYGVLLSEKYGFSFDYDVYDEYYDQCVYLGFSYAGNAVLSEFMIEDLDMYYMNLIIIYRPGENWVEVTTANEIELTDSDVHTSYKVSTEVVGVDLEICGMLNGEDGVRCDWIPQGYSLDYFASPVYDGSTDLGAEVIVTSSDPNVLSVDEIWGTIYAMGAGTATITATSNGYTKSYDITVYPITYTWDTIYSDTYAIEWDGTLEQYTVDVKLTLNFNESPWMSYYVLTGDGAMLYDVSDWDGYTVTLTFLMTPEEFLASQRNSAGDIIVICGLAYEEENEYDLASDICDVVKISLYTNGY